MISQTLRLRGLWGAMERQRERKHAHEQKDLLPEWKIITIDSKLNFLAVFYFFTLSFCSNHYRFQSLRRITSLSDCNCFTIMKNFTIFFSSNCFKTITKAVKMQAITLIAHHREQYGARFLFLLVAIIRKMYWNGMVQLEGHSVKAWHHNT